MTRREDGTAVVVAIGLSALLVAVGLIVGGAIAIFAAHRQAQAAADLAALAGAAAVESGTAACDAARRVAAHNGSEVVHCTAGGAGVDVVVQRTLSGLLTGHRVQARARAGPVT